MRQPFVGLEHEVTVDNHARMQTRLNGQVAQDASTKDIVLDVATLVATISKAIAIHPGGVIVAGTPSGCE
jgi:acylpyruvate hydrolase